MKDEGLQEIKSTKTPSHENIGSAMTDLIQANLTYLSQAERLLDHITDQTFSQPSERFYHSTIGGHLRHCFDHYDSFLNGLAPGKIDYDARLRLPAIEQETAVALAKTEDIRRQLASLRVAEGSQMILVKMDHGFKKNDWQSSTVGREMQFLISHTVHHFAMVGGICFEFEIELEADFGVAPSTLRHRSLGLASAL